MGRPAGSPNKDKPFRDALRMEAIALANGEVITHPPGSLRSLAQALLMKGHAQDVPAIKEVGDRLDGKVPQAIVGDDEHDPIRLDKIERVIVDPANQDGAGVSTAAENRTV